MPTQESQTPIEDNFDDNEIGFKPSPIYNKILGNYIKTIAYLFGRDNVSKLWRQLRTDSNGNLRVTSGTQANNPPRITQPVVLLTGTLILAPNEARKSFILFNTNIGANSVDTVMKIWYNNVAAGTNINLSPGFAYRDDNWAGPLFGISQSQNNGLFVIEYT